MISLPECKRILGSIADNLSDSEVLSIRDGLRELAEIALDTLDDKAKNNHINYPLKAVKKL